MKLKKFLLQIIYYFLSLIVGITYGIGALFIIGKQTIIDLDFLPFIGLYFAVFAFVYLIHFFNIMFHEFGHLVCGLISGYKFISYRVMSFTIAKYNDGIKIKKFAIPGTGGQCILEPPAYNDGDYPYKLYLSGGYLANLFLMVIFAVPVFFLGDFQTIISRILIVSSFLSLTDALMNGLPLIAGQIPNDGFDILSMEKNSFNKKFFWLSLDYNAKTQKGMKIIDYESVINDIDNNVINENKGNKYVPSLIIMKLNILYAKKEFLQAYDLLNESLKDKSLIGLYKNEFLCEKLFTCILLSKTEEIETLYNSELKKYIKATYPYMIARISLMYFYYKLYKNDEKAAEKEKSNFKKLSKKYPNIGEIELYKELMELLSNFRSFTKKC